MSRQFGQQINVPRHQMILGDDESRVPKIRQDLKTSPGDLQFAFDGLIAVGDSAHGHGLWPPSRPIELGGKERGGIHFYEDF